jgi:hypothetical protein
MLGNRTCHLQSRNQIESGIQENRRLQRRLLLFAIGNRKSKIENVVVPVVQRIERRFPKGRTAFLQELADLISSTQTAVFKPVELLLCSSRIISNPHIFTPPGDTTGDTKTQHPFCHRTTMSARANDFAKQFAASAWQRAR